MHNLSIKLGLRFDDRNEEQAFISTYSLDDLGRTQAAMLLGAFVFYVFAVWDWILDPAGARTTHLIRLGICMSVLLPLTAALLTRFGRRHAEFIYLAYCTVPGCMLSLIYSLLGAGFDHAAAGLIIIILFVATLLPMRVLPFAAFCTASWACFTLLEAYAHDGPSLHIVNNFYVGFAEILALVSVLLREVRARRQFRTNAELQREKARAEAALTELRNTQAHLVQSEKLAALGQLVAGVAHEVNTPIGLALTSATAIEDDVRQIGRSIASGQVRRSELTQGLDRLTEGCRLVFANLTRASDLVQSFKQVAVDQTHEERRAFALGPWLRELLRTLEPILRRKGHVVTLECPEDIVLNGYPGALAQVISNLALNAAIHAYPDGRSGRLAIAVTRPEAGGVRIVFSDDGIGIAPDHASKVFDPFFTTRRSAGSTGLGLHIVYNLVVSTLGGRIALNAAPDGGTHFTINLPLSLPYAEATAATA